MKTINALILTGIAVSCLTSFECCATRNKKKLDQAPQQSTQSTTQKEAEPAQPTTLTETQAFKYLRSCIPDLAASWTLLDWSKQTAILNLLRGKQLKVAMSGARTRKEHDLDWAIEDCMRNASSSDLAEIFMRCADQGIKINESSLQAALEYSKTELAR